MSDTLAKLPTTQMMPLFKKAQESNIREEKTEQPAYNEVSYEEIQ
jgi:hypothetical protein